MTHTPKIFLHGSSSQAGQSFIETSAGPLYYPHFKTGVHVINVLLKNRTKLFRVWGARVVTTLPLPHLLLISQAAIKDKCLIF